MLRAWSASELRPRPDAQAAERIANAALAMLKTQQQQQQHERQQQDKPQQLHPPGRVQVQNQQQQQVQQLPGQVQVQQQHLLQEEEGLCSTSGAVESSSAVWGSRFGCVAPEKAARLVAKLLLGLARAGSRNAGAYPPYIRR